MRLRIAGRARSAPGTLGRLFHVLPHYETATGTTGVQRAPSTRGPSDPTPLAPLEAPASASGVIRHDEVPLLARYGTSYGLFDEWICDSVWVSGPLRGDVGGMPVMEVTHLEMLKMKWMR